jgi:hypothetical protein
MGLFDAHTFGPAPGDRPLSPWPEWLLARGALQADLAYAISAAVDHSKS